MSADRVGRAFNDAIARRDIAALSGLMTDDHRFIDTDGNVVVGRDAVSNAWRGFFDAYPDYRNVWQDVRTSGDVLIATGHSVCATEPELDGPAIWTAEVRDGKVAVWRVYEDTPEVRARLGVVPLDRWE